MREYIAVEKASIDHKWRNSFNAQEYDSLLGQRHTSIVHCWTASDRRRRDLEDERISQQRSLTKNQGWKQFMTVFLGLPKKP